MAKAESVKVAVRVRPFNTREKGRNATLIIDMKGNSTYIKDPENLSNQPKSFTFDYSYWSHDGFEEESNGYLKPAGARYADQQKVFDDLGKGVIDNAWKGYNCSLFAYGQTGSGKSYSMVGYGNNKGIVPLFCDDLFKGIEEKRISASSEEEYRVTLSMLEIYSEQVRDLLNPKTINVKGGLKVRQHPNKGFYVEELLSAPVNSYKEIDGKIQEGNRNRTVASTNMNATSSRAHTIVAINFTQKTPNESGQSMTRTSVVNLVDLAGSERADSTGATGDRLKEGSAINKSLSTLGNVIKALADQSTSKKEVLVPYRDSVLTKLLQNALGGNSKTIMIAALSPADINYDETLSTLRFADRAKAIKTTATINESPTDKLIRELREENARLMQLLKEGGISAVQAALAGEAGGNNSEVEDMKKQLEEQLRQNQEEMENMKKSWEERIKESGTQNADSVAADNQKREQMKVTPHLWNLNEDPALTGMVVHLVSEGKSRIGNRKASPPPEIMLNGLSIQKDHAVITNKGGKVSIKPMEKAKILVNGQRIISETQLHHNDRILMGANSLYVFHHPQDEARLLKEGKKSETPTFDTAQEEIAQKSGLVSTEGKSKEDVILQEEVVQMLQIANEANAMSEELGKNVKFEVALISGAARGQPDARTEVMLKMITPAGNEFLWDRNKSINRKSLMQEIYQDYISGEENWDVPQDQDPFWEPPETEVPIGNAHLHLMSLAHKFDIEENLVITDYKGTERGHLNVEVWPCDSNFKPLNDEDDYVDEPIQLVGKDLFFIIKVTAVKGLPANFVSSHCKYKFYTDVEYTKTGDVSGMNPLFNHNRNVKQCPVTNQFIEYLQEKPLVIEVWGKQKGDKSSTSKQNKKAADKKPAKSSSNEKPKPQKKDDVAPPPPTPSNKNNSQQGAELQAYKKRATEAEGTVQNLQNLLSVKRQNGQSISVEELENILKGSSVKPASGNDGSKACVVQ